jgi:DNA-binding SARP family transcriptional activator
MRLRYLAGDRTGAIRQFERCREALREEFGIAPGERTRLLYEQLKSDDRLPQLPDEGNSPGSVPATPRTPQEIGETTVPASKSPSAAVTSPHQVAETLERSLAALAEATGLVEDSLQALRQTSP